MTLSTILAFARTQCQTDSNGLTDANGIIFANEALLDFHRNLIDKGVDASQIQEAYADITANVGTYLYPSNMFFLKAIELNTTDQTAQNYLPVEQVDASNLPGNTSFSWLRSNQSSASPLFDDRGDWFELFPTPTTGNSQGIRILYFLTPTEFAATSDTVSYPDSLDYRALGWRIAANYKRSLLDFNSAQAFDNEYTNHMTQISRTLARGTQQPTQASPIRDAGWNY
jgi:hypothetical protein